MNSVPFNALLAIDDPNASQLSGQAGADGFQMDSTPLFQVLFSSSKISKSGVRPFYVQIFITTFRLMSVQSGTCIRFTQFDQALVRSVAILWSVEPLAMNSPSGQVSTVAPTCTRFP